MNIFKNLENFKNRICAITDEGNKYSYKQLINEGLKYKYIKPRSIVFLISENSIDFLIIYTHLIKFGSVVFLINHDIHKDKFHLLINIYKPKFIFVNKNYLFSLNKYELNREYNSYKIYEYKIFKDTQVSNNLSLLISTSGTTGSKKFVMLSYSNIYFNTLSIIKYLKINKNSRTITNLAPSYSYGFSIINTFLYSGASIVITKSTIIEKKFWELFDYYSVNNFNGVPFTYETLDKIGFFKKDFKNLKCATIAGGPLNVDLLKKFILFFDKKNIQFYNMYGQTEASPRMSYINLQKLKKNMGSIGKPIFGGKFILKDDSNNIIKNNYTNGNLHYIGKNIMLGYATCRSSLKKIKVIKILKTFDIAYRNRNGFYFIVGRKSRIKKINSIRINLDELQKQIKLQANINNIIIEQNNSLIIFLEGNENNENIEQNDIINTISKIIRINKNFLKIRRLKKFPYLSNGKINYKILEK
jgi:long-chain acyl-CoA synthetase